MFGIGLTSVAKILYEFCESIFEESEQFIKFPANGHETALEIEKFSYFTQTVLVQLVGVIDWTHEEILCTNAKSRVDYFSHKQKYTVNTQAAAGANLMLLPVATGYPGSLHDARILRVSSLFGRLKEMKYLHNPPEVLMNLMFDPWFSVIVHISEQCGWLSLILLGKTYLYSSSVLHNICQKRGDLYIHDGEVLENVLINECLIRGGHNNNQNCSDADALRDVIAEYMFSNIWISVRYIIRLFRYLKTNPPAHYVSKINNTDRLTGSELCSELTIKIP